MKKRVRIQQSNPYYSSEPAVARNLMADQSLTQNSGLGNSAPKMVDKKPGRLSGVAGFSSKSKPSSKPAAHVPATKVASPAKSPPQMGSLRNSGHPKAHRLGGKLKI